MSSPFARFTHHTAFVRNDDVSRELIEALQTANINCEVLNPIELERLFGALGGISQNDDFWPKGMIYFVPKGASMPELFGPGVGSLPLPK